jgi:hypothetical protein
METLNNFIIDPIIITAKVKLVSMNNVIGVLLVGNLIIAEISTTNDNMWGKYKITSGLNYHPQIKEIKEFASDEDELKQILENYVITFLGILED